MIRKSLIVKSLALSVVLMLPITVSNPVNAFTDKYANFNELQANEIKGVDYKINSIDTCSDVAIIAIHGGSIEKGTTQLAQALAKKGSYDYYSFQGIKRSNNLSLHITSTRFDEPIGTKLVAKSTKTISIHGFSGDSKVTYIGGLDTKLVQKITNSLKAAGFSVAEAPNGLKGVEKSNIANRNLSGMGVQLELSRTLRDSFFTSIGATNQTFDKYVSALEKALK